MDKIFKLLTGSLLNCSNHEFPPQSSEFLSQLTASYLIALCVATLVFGATIALFVLQVICVGQYCTEAYRRAFILYLAGLAPFCSGGALVSLFMPRTWFLTHLLSFLYFSIGIYVVVCLLFSIVDGKHSAVKRMTQSSAHIIVTTPPFCCLCPRMPKLPVQMRRIRFCELMVLQCPMVRLAGTVISLILYFEYFDKAFVAMKVLDFVFLPSLLCGIYGCHILVNTVSKLDETANFRFLAVFRLFDFSFLVFGLQFPLFELFARAGVFGCGGILPALETSFFWKNFATVIESLFVSVIASLLLKPSRSAFFDKYQPGCRSQSAVSSAVSMATIESTETTTTT